MQITKRTKLKHLIPLLASKERIESILEQIDEYPLKNDVLSMTVGEFSEIVLEEEKFIAAIMRPNERAYIALGQLKNYRRQMKQLLDWIKKFQVKQTQDEKAAAVNIQFPDFCSRILLTVTDYFHLKSFKEAEDVPLADYLLILQEQSTSIQYQRAYNRLIEMKNKSKQKKK